MIAKIVKGQTFRGVINYVLNQEKQAELLDSQGVRTNNVQSLIDGFNLQTNLNPRIKKTVGHISLDFSFRDKEKLSNKKMIRIAEAYMDRMGIKDTQYVLVRHHDTEHPHVHLVFNRVDNNGKTISDQNDRYRSGLICKKLTKEYELYFAPGKDHVKIHQLREPEKTKYTIYRVIKVAILRSNTWNDLIAKLKDYQISVQFKFKGKIAEVQGVSFSMNGYCFSGSKVDRQFSFLKITSRLELTQQNDQMEESRKMSCETNDRSVLGNYLGSLVRSLENQCEWERREGKQTRTSPRIKRRKGIRR